MADFLLGANAGLYFAASGADAGAAGTEITNCEDLTANMGNEEFEFTTRANAGVSQTASTTSKWELSWKMIFKPSDAGFAAIKNAWLNKTPIALAALTEKNTESTAEGPKGDWSITGFSMGQPIKGVITVDVSAKAAGNNSWQEPSGS